MKSLIRITFSVLIVILMGGLFYQYGRVIWHPLISTLNGTKSVGDVCSEVEGTKPYLKSLMFKSLSILIFKQEKVLYIYADNKRIMKIPILAASGKLGPKLRECDMQVPEGIY